MYSSELVSVIIPIYNTENYLDKCIQTVCEQTYKNIEIILINDGSEDGSAEICMKWQMIDNRIRYYEQKHLRQGAARNKGIDLSQGNYITFIDSDDWVESTYIEALLCKMLQEQGDVCSCNMIQFDEKEKKYIGKLRPLEQENFTTEQNPHMAGRMYRKKIFTEYDIRLPLCYFEDLAVYPLIAILSERNSVITEPLYCYRRNTGNSTMDSYKNIVDYPKALNFLFDKLKQYNKYCGKETFLLDLTMGHLVKGLRKARRSCIEEYSTYLNIFREFLNQAFPNWKRRYDKKYWVLGSYNLSRIAMNLMFDYDINNYDTTHFEFSSIVSIMSEPVEENSPPHKNYFRNNMIERDWKKSFKFSQFGKNDYILIDFLEERYDLIMVGLGRYITDSDALKEAEYCNESEIVNSLSLEKRDLWKRACDLFINLLKENFLSSHVVLVKMYLNEKYIDQQEIKEFSIKKIKEINNMLEVYYNYFEKEYQGIQVINIPEERRYSDGEFVFGCLPEYLRAEAIYPLSREILDRLELV